MGGKKGENSKKAAGMARKAEVAAQKQAVSDAKKAADEDRKWQQGAKSNAKKKAERDALLAAEEASQPSKPKGAGAKSAAKKTRGTLDFSHLDAALGVSTSGSKKAAALNASGIDNALDALSLTSNSESTKIDRHPERRFKSGICRFRGTTVTRDRKGTTGTEKTTED
ncbi:hypothetical protein CISG_00344 [Coccidioides immitis RMSCC 3703]|uniref:Uncharacterized protein n=1 Tax=Coccidioides immitis RMSCC 3703 TaxID=454286 RepID=A0A0J8QHW3_COCIT|nr:hypothetical protein CISG_00344 [Coccidioides immitis RMSCC 3703]